MKRINIAVDMDDNEIFTKSIQEAVTNQAKQTAREQFKKVLELELERIVDVKLKQAKESHYYSDMGRKIATLVAEHVARDIPVSTSEINQLIEQKVGLYMDKKIESRGGLDNYLQSYMDKSIAAALMKRANDNR